MFSSLIRIPCYRPDPHLYRDSSDMYVCSSQGYTMTGQSLPLHRSRYIIAPCYGLEKQVHGKDRPDEGRGIPPGHTDPWAADEAKVFIVNVLDGLSYTHQSA